MQPTQDDDRPESFQELAIVKASPRYQTPRQAPSNPSSNLVGHAVTSGVTPPVQEAVT